MTCFDIYCQMLLWEIVPICTPSLLIGNSHFLYSSCSQIIASYISCLITFLVLIIGGGAFPHSTPHIFLFWKRRICFYFYWCVCVHASPCVSLKDLPEWKFQAQTKLQILWNSSKCPQLPAHSLAQLMCLFYCLEAVSSFPTFPLSMCCALKLFNQK